MMKLALSALLFSAVGGAQILPPVLGIATTGTRNGFAHERLITISPSEVPVGIASATYTSGLTVSGTGFCYLTSLNNGNTGGVIQVNVTSGAVTSLTVNSSGTGSTTSATTAATVTSGTATCSGTPAFTSTLTSSLSNYTQLVCANITLGNGASCPTVTDIATVANSGAVQNTVAFNGQTSPADLIFTSDAGCTTLLSWDVGYYSPTTGAIAAWVLMSSLSSSSNTTFYMCYGKASVSTYQGGAVGAAYDANTVSRYHLSDGTTLNLHDSSGGTATLTNSGLGASTGEIDGGVSNGGTGFAVSASSSRTASGNPLTIEIWVNLSANVTTQAATITVGTNGSGSPTGLQFSMGPRNSSVTGNSGCGVASAATALGALATNSWVMMTCVDTLGSGSGDIILYKNGTFVARAANTVAFAGDSKTGVMASLSAGGAGTNITGNADEAIVSNVQRSQVWITTDFNAMSAPNTYTTFGAEI